MCGICEKAYVGAASAGKDHPLSMNEREARREAWLKDTIKKMLLKRSIPPRPHGVSKKEWDEYHRSRGEEPPRDGPSELTKAAKGFKLGGVRPPSDVAGACGPPPDGVRIRCVWIR